MRKYEVLEDFEWCDIKYKIGDKIQLNNEMADFIAKNGIIKNPRIKQKDIDIHKLINELSQTYHYSGCAGDYYENLANKWYDQGINIETIKQKLHKLSKSDLIEIEKLTNDLQQENRRKTQSK